MLLHFIASRRQKSSTDGNDLVATTHLISSLMQQRKPSTMSIATSIHIQESASPESIVSHSSRADRKQGRIRLRQAIANAYSPLMGKQIDPNTEVVVTTGANEGILCAFMGFVEAGDEVIVFEPYFDQ